ncbi:uncharacterized protein [Dermacentor albipictus]|uniref:uncharacterized protein isoform X2 n=1 Tax=Dermacentor albipictus TaxID=60249 RepID=UPI0031FBDB75
MKVSTHFKIAPSMHILSLGTAKLLILFAFTGHVSSTSAKNCTRECEACVPGTHASSACNCCPIRGHCPKPAANDASDTLCLPCNTGTFCKDLGCPACDPCPPGTSTAQRSAQNCTPCEAGFYKPFLGSGTCSACSQGSYTLLRGSTECTVCPAGFYCSCTHCGPLPCPDDAICPVGSTQPTYCYKPLFVKHGYSCYMSDSAIGIIIGVCIYSRQRYEVSSSCPNLRAVPCSLDFLQLGSKQSTDDGVAGCCVH